MGSHAVTAPKFCFCGYMRRNTCTRLARAHLVALMSFSLGYVTLGLAGRKSPERFWSFSEFGGWKTLPLKVGYLKQFSNKIEEATPLPSELEADTRGKPCTRRFLAASSIITKTWKPQNVLPRLSGYINPFRSDNGILVSAKRKRATRW